MSIRWLLYNLNNKYVFCFIPDQSSVVWDCYHVCTCACLQTSISFFCNVLLYVSVIWLLFFPLTSPVKSYLFCIIIMKHVSVSPKPDYQSVWIVAQIFRMWTDWLFQSNLDPINIDLKVNAYEIRQNSWRTTLLIIISHLSLLLQYWEQKCIR